MQLGMIGLGRMGASLVRRLTKDGHQCVVYDVNPTSAAVGGQGSGRADRRRRRLVQPQVGGCHFRLKTMH